MDSFTDGDLQDYLDGDPGGPVVMLNLLRFAPGGGAQKYMEYVASFEESGLNRDYGIEVVFAGQVFPALIAEQDAHDWDMIALVRYRAGRASSRWCTTRVTSSSSTCAPTR